MRQLRVMTLSNRPPSIFFEGKEAEVAVKEKETKAKLHAKLKVSTKEGDGTSSKRRAGEGKVAKEHDSSPQKRGKKNAALGKRGEEAAAKFLYSRGYEILERNWKCFAGEADIIAKDGQCLVFVEVKTRKDTRKGFPSEAVNAEKREKYERIALAYVSEFEETDIPIRFDVISIVVVAPDRAMIRHSINAFSR